MGALSAAPARADGPAPNHRVADYEVGFMTNMIDHHQMAIVMSQPCLDKAVHAKLRAMCQDIIAAQRAEIDTMQGWLADRYGVDYEPQMSTGDMRPIIRR